MRGCHLVKLLDASLGGSTCKLIWCSLLLPAASTQADDCGAKERKRYSAAQPSDGLTVGHVPMVLGLWRQPLDEVRSWRASASRAGEHYRGVNVTCTTRLTLSVRKHLLSSVVGARLVDRLMLVRRRQGVENPNTKEVDLVSGSPEATHLDVKPSTITDNGWGGLENLPAQRLQLRLYGNVHAAGFSEEFAKRSLSSLWRRAT